MKKLVKATVAVLSAIFLTFGISGCNKTVQQNAEEQQLPEPRGLATNLTLSIGEEDGEVWAQVKNVFTLFDSTIFVYLELYSSETYQESYLNMDLIQTASTPDLNMGQTLRISASTEGTQKYWQARMRYKFDERDWVTKTTDSLLYGENIETPPIQENTTPQPDPQPDEPVRKLIYSNESLNNFTHFYENELELTNKEKFYLLNIDVANTSYSYPTNIVYYGKNNLDNNTVASEYANIYVDEFGTGMNTNSDTGIPCFTFSLNLDFKLLPDNYYKGNNIKIELTEYIESKNLDYKVKILDGDILIAEGTYEQTVEVPQEWLVNYIKENLI